MVPVERLLDGMQRPVRGHAFDGGDLASVRLDCQDRAGLHGLSVEKDGARPAGGRVAADVGACEPERVPQEEHEKLPGFDLSLTPNPVHGESDAAQGASLLSSRARGSTAQGMWAGVAWPGRGSLDRASSTEADARERVPVRFRRPEPPGSTLATPTPRSRCQPQSLLSSLRGGQPGTGYRRCSSRQALRVFEPIDSSLWEVQTWVALTIPLGPAGLPLCRSITPCSSSARVWLPMPRACSRPQQRAGAAACSSWVSPGWAKLPLCRPWWSTRRATFGSLSRVVTPWSSSYLSGCFLKPSTSWGEAACWAFREREWLPPTLVPPVSSRSFAGWSRTPTLPR